MKTYKATVIFFIVTFCFTLVVAFSLFPITKAPAKKQEVDRKIQTQEVIAPVSAQINDLYLVVGKEGGEVEKIYISEEGAKKYLNENNNTRFFEVQILSNIKDE